MVDKKNSSGEKRYILTLQTIEVDEIKIHHIEYTNSTMNGLHLSALDILLDNTGEQ